MTEKKGLLYVPYQDTLGLLSVEDALNVCEQVYLMHARGSVVLSNPPSFKLDVADGFNNHWHVKSVFLKDMPATGVRVYNYFDDGVRNTVGGLDCTRFIVLSDPHRGVPLAIVDEHWSYAIRSAAAATLACRWVGPKNPKILGLVGIGTMGTNALRCLATMYKFAEIRCTSRRPETRAAFAEKWSKELGVPVVAKDSIEQVVRGADLAVGGTTSGDIVTREEWLKPGATFISLARRELDPAGWGKMDKVVIDSWEYNMLQREFKRMVESGQFSRNQLHGEIQELVAGTKRGRERDDERILIHTTGLVSQDVALAHFIYQRALEKNLHLAADGALKRNEGLKMDQAAIKTLLEAKISRERAKQLLIELVKVPSPQTELLEDEPLLKEFIKKAIEPRLREMGFADVRYDAMGNLIATYGTAKSGKSLMIIGNAMNQPASTMPNPYNGDVVDGAKYGLPGECVMGKGASEQKANLAAMLHAMETVIASKVPMTGQLVFTCCLSGETGKHDAIKSVVEGAGVRADMALLGGTGLMVTLGNRGRIDIFVTVKGSPCHSARPWDGVNAITGAMEALRLLFSRIKLDGEHPQLGKRTLTVNHIRSFPESTHTVQERCEFTLDRRLLPGDDPNEAFAEIEKVLKEVAQIRDPVSGKNFGIDVRMGPYMYPSLVTAESPIVKALMDAGTTMLGRPPETYFSPAAFDQGYLNHVGIPTANFGAGENQWAHTDFDMASVERTTDSAKVYAFMMLDYLT